MRTEQLQPGAKVIFANPEYGYEHDQASCREHLTFGQAYTIATIEVDSWFTAIELTEVPGVTFNSVMFEPA